jgi:rhamnosyltransferase subunit B
MARVLIGWELGANKGHVLPIAEIAGSLLRDGHEIIAVFSDLRWRSLLPTDVRIVIQGPTWPKARVGFRSNPFSTVGIADVLLDLGLAEPGVFSTLLSQWDQIFLDYTPDVILADYAPALLCAAFGKVPLAAIGTGFTCPPATVPFLPRFGHKLPTYDALKTVININKELRKCGKRQIGKLPEIFRTDVELLGTIRDARTNVRYMEIFAPTPRSGNINERSEIFVYTYEDMLPENRFWDAIWAPGIPVRIHMANPSDAQRERIQALGMILEDQPVPFEEIARRSKLVISHGSHGLIAKCVLAGIPILSVVNMLERELNAQAVERMGVGTHFSMKGLNARVLAEKIHAMWNDDSLSQQCALNAQRLGQRRTSRYSCEVRELLSS